MLGTLAATLIRLKVFFTFKPIIGATEAEAFVTP